MMICTMRGVPEDNLLVLEEDVEVEVERDMMFLFLRMRIRVRVLLTAHAQRIQMETRMAFYSKNRAGI
jgi:hypothetical protein